MTSFWEPLRRVPGEAEDAYMRRLADACATIAWRPPHQTKLVTLTRHLPMLSDLARQILLIQALARRLTLEEVHGTIAWHAARRWIRSDADPLLIVMDATWRITHAYTRMQTWRMPADVPEDHLYGAVLARLHATGGWPSIAAKDAWIAEHLGHAAPFDADELRALLTQIDMLPRQQPATTAAASTL